MISPVRLKLGESRLLHFRFFLYYILYGYNLPDMIFFYLKYIPFFFLLKPNCSVFKLYNHIHYIVHIYLSIQIKNIRYDAEDVTRGSGETKNDCRRNRSRRYRYVDISLNYNAFYFLFLFLFLFLINIFLFYV